MNLIFANRADAALRLAKKIPDVDRASTIVLALPRGGVPIGAIVARELGVPLDVALVRKIGAPGQRELAVGAVSDGAGMQVTVNRDVAAAVGLSAEAVRRMGEAELPELKRRRKLYCGDKPALPVNGKTVIVVDDGIATGATMRAALRLIRQNGARRIVLAVPVAPADVIDEMKREADEIVCLDMPVPFFAVGAHYADFAQIGDDEVVAMLKDFAAPPKS